MSKLQRVTQPFRTPLVRRYFTELFKPGVATAQALGKRSRPYPASPLHPKSDGENDDPATCSSPSTGQRHLSNCVALQNCDPTISDAVIITSLQTLPFCCHADLVTMSRHQLLQVAQVLNERLPQALQIDTSPEKSDAFIRNSVELLVGIQNGTLRVPGAPKADRSFRGIGGIGGSSSVLLDGYASPGRSTRELLLLDPLHSPISPLASRSRSIKEGEFSFGLGSKILGVLEEETEEEDEGEEADEEVANFIGNMQLNKPLKKKRKVLDHEFLFSTPTRSNGTHGALMGRSRSQRTPLATRNRSGIAANAHRSQSQKLPNRSRRNGLIGGSLHPNVTLRRARTSKLKPAFVSTSAAPKSAPLDIPSDFTFDFSASFTSIQTSTPKKRKRVPSDTDSEMDCDADTSTHAIISPSISFGSLQSAQASQGNDAPGARLTYSPFVDSYASSDMFSLTPLPSPWSTPRLASGANGTSLRKFVFGTIEPDTDVEMTSAFNGLSVSWAEAASAASDGKDSLMKKAEATSSGSDMDISVSSA